MQTRRPLRWRTAANSLPRGALQIPPRRRHGCKRRAMALRTSDEQRPQPGYPRASRLLPRGGSRRAGRRGTGRPVCGRSSTHHRAGPAGGGCPAEVRPRPGRSTRPFPRSGAGGAGRCGASAVARRGGHGGARSSKKRRQPRGIARDPRSLRGLRPAHHRHPARIRRWQPASAGDVRGRGAGARRGPRGPAVRRPLGQAA